MTKQHELVIQYLPVASVSQHPENANNGDLEALEESIAVSGFYSPVIVQASTRYVIAGNHRLLAVLRSGAATIPAIVLDLTDEEAKRIMVADNRTTRLGFDDEGQLANLLEDLYATDLGLSGTGYDHEDFEKLMALVNEPLTAEDLGVGEDTEDPERSAPPVHRLNFSIMPVIDDDGTVHELTLSRANYSHISANDLNLLRKALGQQPLDREELLSWGVPDWEERLR